MRRTLLLLLASVPLLVPRASAETFSGRVVGISDGDTISVMRHAVGKTMYPSLVPAGKRAGSPPLGARRFALSTGVSV